MNNMMWYLNLVKVVGGSNLQGELPTHERGGMRAMSDYASDDQMTAAAQSCRHFKSNRHHDNGSGSLSCSGCKHWSGNICVKNDFDTIVTNLNIE